MSDLLSVRDIMRISGQSFPVVMSWIKSGELKASNYSKSGGQRDSWRVEQKDWVAFQKARSVPQFFSPEDIEVLQNSALVIELLLRFYRSKVSLFNSLKESREIGSKIGLLEERAARIKEDSELTSSPEEVVREDVDASKKTKQI